MSKKLTSQPQSPLKRSANRLRDGVHYAHLTASLSLLKASTCQRGRNSPRLVDIAERRLVYMADKKKVVDALTRYVPQEELVEIFYDLMCQLETCTRNEFYADEHPSIEEITKRKPSFRQLCALEPRLSDLAKEAKSIKAPSGKGVRFCANVIWYGYDGHTSLKQKLLGLVGDHAASEKLRNSQSYDIAYQHIYSLLPPCQGCACG